MEATEKKHTSSEVKKSEPGKKESSGDKHFDNAVDLLLKPFPKPAPVK